MGLDEIPEEEEVKVLCVDKGSEIVPSVFKNCHKCNKDIAVSEQAFPHYPEHATFWCLLCALDSLELSPEETEGIIEAATEGFDEVQENIDSWELEGKS